MGKCLLAFVVAAAREFGKDMSARHKREEIITKSSSSFGSLETRPSVEKAIKAGVDALVTTFIKTLLEEPIMKQFDEVFRGITPGNSSFTDCLKVYLTKEFVKLFTTETMTAISDSLINAWKDSVDSKGNLNSERFEQLVKANLLEKLKTIVTGRLKALEEGFAEDEMKTFLADLGIKG